MKVLIPFNFSENCIKAIQFAQAIKSDSETVSIVLLHCYSRFSYNRDFDYEDEYYEEEVENKIVTFCEQRLNFKAKPAVVFSQNAWPDEIELVSTNYNLLILSSWMSNNSAYITSHAHCSVLLFSSDDRIVNFVDWNSIIHINRGYNESLLLSKHLTNFKVIPSIEIIEFTLPKKWEIFRDRLRQIISLKPILNSIFHPIELRSINAIVLVCHNSQVFESLLRSRIMKRIQNEQIPLLVLQDSVEKLNS